MADSKGHLIYTLCGKLFPICRSLTGTGVRETLAIIKEQIGDLAIHEVPSGTKCFDWIVPKEWNIRSAYIIDPDGKRVVDFRQSNLHVVGYSIPVDKIISLEELQNHLFSIPDQPTAIPYVTSYYKERWGFCLAHQQRIALKDGNYHVYIDSELVDGSLTYGELILPGQSSEEIFLSTYICHPSMANNEVSGPAVTSFIAEFLKNLRDRKYTYRIIFIPETIGSIIYLSRHYREMKQNVVAGFNVTCVGDERTYSFLPSRRGNTLADRVAKHALKYIFPDFKQYSFLDRGSDERQYCSPGIDLPVCSVMRSKYGEYPEYHTSLDDLSLITPSGLQGAYDVLKSCLLAVEGNGFFKSSVLCEPQMGKRNLYPTIGLPGTAEKRRAKNVMNVLAYLDGTKDLIDVAELIHLPVWEVVDIINILKSESLIENINTNLKGN